MAIVTTRSRRALLGGALASLIATLALAVPAAAGEPPTTRYVDDDDPGCGPSPYATVQAAVDDSNAGDTILVCPGEYVGGFTINSGDPFFHPNDLTIRAVDPWTATIVAPDGIDEGNLIVVANVSGTLIKWLEVVAPTGGACDLAGTLIVAVNAPDTSIRANHLQPRGTDTLDGPCGYIAGIFLTGSDDSVVAWNRIIDFTRRGIAVDDSHDVDIHGNSVRFLHASETGSPEDTIGIDLELTRRARVANNVVRSLPSAGVSTPRLSRGIGVDFSTETRLIGNRVFYARQGMQADLRLPGVVRENRIRHSGATRGSSRSRP